MIAAAVTGLALLVNNAPAAPAAGAPVAQLVIPRIQKRVPVYESISSRVLARGVGIYPGTSLPGKPGTVAIAGHRVTYARPFRHLNRVRKGDAIVLRTRWGTFWYRVYAMRVVRPGSTWVLNGRRARRVVLTTCHPPGTASYRLVVFARQVATTR